MGKQTQSGFWRIPLVEGDDVKALENEVGPGKKKLQCLARAPTDVCVTTKGPKKTDSILQQEEFKPLFGQEISLMKLPGEPHEKKELTSTIKEVEGFKELGTSKPHPKPKPPPLPAPATQPDEEDQESDGKSDGSRGCTVVPDGFNAIERILVNEKRKLQAALSEVEAMQASLPSLKHCLASLEK